MNFTELLTAMVNETIAKMVVEATAKYEAQITALQCRVDELLNAIATDLGNVMDRVSELENSDNSTDIDNAVEAAFNNLDFAEAIEENLDANLLFRGDEFCDAVREVIVDALRR